MFKHVLAAAAACTIVAGPALADDPVHHSFRYRGDEYVYTDRVVGAIHYLTGSVQGSGEEFALRVDARWVTGTVGGRPVAFRVSEAQPVRRTEVVLTR